MKFKNFLLKLFLCTLFGVALVTALFAFSEDVVHRNNSFIRRYPHHPAVKLNSMDLKYNSYYIAGVVDERIYLGNITAPLHLLSLDKNLEDTLHIRMELDEKNKYPFRNVRIRIEGSHFFLYDGTIPVIFKGKIGDWCALPILQDSAYFSRLEPMGQNSFIFRARSSLTNENELGLIQLENKTMINLNPSLLEKQIDGVFDTDGMLLFNSDKDRAVYIYYYRNEFIVIHDNLKLDYRGKTIDTINRADIKLIDIESKNKRTLASKAEMVNRTSSTSGNYLFINSDRLGKYESGTMLKQASIVDVYDLTERTYEFSFYIYHIKKERIREFMVEDNLLISLNGKSIVTYTLKPEYFKFPPERKEAQEIMEKVLISAREKIENL